MHLMSRSRSSDSRTMAYRGNVAALLGDLPDAERRLAAAAAAALKPRDKADARTRGASSSEAADRPGDAADCYDRALAAVPGHAKARANRDALLSHCDFKKQRQRYIQ